PNNPIGDAALAMLRKLGVNSEKVIRDGDYIGMYFLENGFGERASRVTYSNRKESSFNRASVTIYDDVNLQEIDYIHFCGISLAMNDTVREQMKKLAHRVKSAGGKVIFDCNYRPKHWGENGSEQAY